MDEWFEVVVEILQSHKQGDYSILQEAETLPENAPIDIKALLCMSLCQMAMDANEAELAEEYLQMAIECADEDATNMVQHEQLFYLECLLNSKFFHQFDKTIAKARGSRYKNHYLMQSIVGDCLYWCGHFSEAREVYTKILDENTAEDFNSEEYLYKLASTYVQLNETDESRKILEQIVANHPHISDDTPEYVFHAIAKLVGLSPYKPGLYTQELQNLELKHPYKNAYLNHILGLDLFVRGVDDLDKAEYFFHSVLQAPIRDFEKLPSVRFLIHTYHKTNQREVMEPLVNKYSFTNMYWEQEIQNILSPEKLESPIETQEPPYEEKIETPVVPAESETLVQEVADTIAQKEDATQQTTTPIVEKEETTQQTTAPIADKENATQQTDTVQRVSKNILQNVSPTKNDTENNTQDTEDRETSIPLTALLLGLESFHKQN
ncbi:tetratricopeptide repeat protein [Candidatus Uabimicrobium amorphum]|uniref:Tetratricopeptide repeat protein n=1 Tax=Uabimicrobium amorphum TaxID=2596890 RepID=A0A5S9IVC4_UABAM|nr:tetratricopeptide repeat protein [Candidatus Uabimicrobium amorphum]BBM88191.1 hypothetical protein UABAM_06608 [Candidatus Uabimicrobium amorphum]